MKTNAVRILEAANINFSTVEYPVNEDELDAISVATKINADPEQVFKTLVAKSDTGYYVFCIPGNLELNLKKAANAANVKKIEMLPLKELTNVTGYVRGGCSPIGMKKLFPTFIDETALLFDQIYVSAGMRGMQLFINPNLLANSINAKFADLI